MNVPAKFLMYTRLLIHTCVLEIPPERRLALFAVEDIESQTSEVTCPESLKG